MLDEIESYVRDQAKKDVKKEMLPLMRIGAKEIFPNGVPSKLPKVDPKNAKLVTQ